MCCFHSMLDTSASLNTARSPVSPIRNFEEPGGVLDLVTNSLHHRRDALRREDAGRHDIGFAPAEVFRGVNRGMPGCWSLSGVVSAPSMCDGSRSCGSISTGNVRSRESCASYVWQAAGDVPR